MGVWADLHFRLCGFGYGLSALDYVVIAGVLFPAVVEIAGALRKSQNETQK